MRKTVSLVDLLKKKADVYFAVKFRDSSKNTLNANINAGMEWSISKKRNVMTGISTKMMDAQLYARSRPLNIQLPWKFN